MRITILAVGKIKESYFREAVTEYSKRLLRYCELKIVEVADEPVPEKASPAELERIKDKEGARLLKASDPKAYRIALAIDAKQRSSEGFSKELERLAVSGISSLELFIGGSVGLSDEVLESANEKLSFSTMTFPHQLMRVILLEQIYRAYRISRKEPYHK